MSVRHQDHVNIIATIQLEATPVAVIPAIPKLGQDVN